MATVASQDTLGPCLVRKIYTLDANVNPQLVRNMACKVLHYLAYLVCNLITCSTKLCSSGKFCVRMLSVEVLVVIEQLRSYVGEEDEEEDSPMRHMAIRGSGRENQQGYNFVRVQTLGMDSDMLAESPPPPPLLTEPHQHSSSSQIRLDSYNDGNVAEVKDYGDTEAGNYITKASSRGLRSKAGPKCDAKNSTGEEATPAVVFQKLKPGTDNKKGIPDDGHRGWKKYGNKVIQNSSFCRYYLRIYVCSFRSYA